MYHGLALLLQGTPQILYGDELEYNDRDKFMKWDNVQPGCGFTNSSSVPRQKCTHTVKHALAYGGSDTSLLRMYEKLIKVINNSDSNIIFNHNVKLIYPN